MMMIAPACGQGGDALDRAMDAVFQASPYLSRLAQQRRETVMMLRTAGFASVLARAHTVVDQAGGKDDFAAVMADLRAAKADVHLALGLADLAGLADHFAVTEGLTAFADVALSAALRAGEHHMRACGDLAGPLQGYCIVAMGKHGARELNYSSDIDLIVFYAPNWLALGPQLDARETAVRLTQRVVRAMQEVTADGYVFRTDLRLRPDPGSTAVAISFAAAERYYQSVGENWERAAFIKARACAGDIEMGSAFIASLRPFLWRRHLDYAAIDDIRAIQRQIHRFHGSAPLEDPVFDVKLGRGGIRDIELFVQTQQLILGGRAPALRTPATLDALAVLADAGIVPQGAAAQLSAAYRVWRAIEHRLQMRLDEQTHAMPSDVKTRAAVARLCGYEDLAIFDADVVALRKTVAALCETLTEPMRKPGALARAAETPDWRALLQHAGFRDPDMIAARIDIWCSGGVRAARSPRARALLDQCLPSLLVACAAQEGADDAFSVFGDFLESLPAGVQVLALLEARPDILLSLVELFALAPRMAQDLSRRTTMIDAMGEARFFAPIAGESAGVRVRQLQGLAANETSFESAINSVRRYHREEAFRITVQLLRRLASPRAAGHAFADLADACVAAIAHAAHSEVERMAGAAPGRWCVAALGKFAGGELTAHSDLDVMVVYDAPEGARSSGEKALAPGDFYARFAQRLITGLSAPTEEGLLYDIDMQLRPSGAKGPVAVRLSSFQRYYREEAWTWELQALSRMRIVAGDAILGATVTAAAQDALVQPRDRAVMRADIAAMRARLDRDKPPEGALDLKRMRGGLIDIEFIAQGLLLCDASDAVVRPAPSTAALLADLARTHALSVKDEALLRQAFDLYSDLQHVLRAATMAPWDPAAAPPALQKLLEALAGAASLQALTAQLDATAAAVRATFDRLMQPVAAL